MALPVSYLCNVPSPVYSGPTMSANCIGQRDAISFFKALEGCIL